jgi:polysaccharide deacetylase 2 family uncharacterized protein YibQ
MAQDTKSSRLSIGQWVLLVLIAACLCGWVSMVIPWFTQASERTDAAMEQGLFTKIVLETGEIKGKAPEPAPKTAEPPKAEAKDPQPVAIQEETHAETPPTHTEDATKEHSAETKQEPTTPHTESPVETIKKEASEQSVAAPVAPVSTSPEHPDTQPAAPEKEMTPTKSQPEATHESTPAKNISTAETTTTSANSSQAASLGIQENKELLESFNGKQLPVISKTGVRPSQYYARPDATPKTAPVIALTISGLGLHKEVTLQAIQDLPPQISLSFTPYARDVSSWIIRANTNGHEAWLDIPMEYADYPANDPGPLGLMKGLTEQENLLRLKQTLSSAIGYVGIIAPKDEIFTGYTMMQIMHTEVMQRGLYMLLRSRAFKPENEAGGVLYSSRSLTKEKSREETLQSLQELEVIAKDYGYAVGVVDASPALIAIIHEWQRDLSKRQIQLVPLSAIPQRHK